MRQEETGGHRESEAPNRQKILQAALRLFSASSYPEVSMRDIAAEVGIKASSIYNHFSGKEAILDEIVLMFRRELEKRSMNADNEDWDGAIRREGPKAVLVRIMLAPIELLADPELVYIIRVVTRCQYYHAGIRTFLLQEMMHRPQALLIHVLSRMIELGLIEEYPADFLAGELQGVLIAGFYQLSLRTDELWVDMERIRQAMELHLEFFWRAARKVIP